MQYCNSVLGCDRWTSSMALENINVFFLFPTQKLSESFHKKLTLAKKKNFRDPSQHPRGGLVDLMVDLMVDPVVDLMVDPPVDPTCAI